MKTATKPKYSFTVEARPAKLGGGWKLTLLEDDLEVGGGVYPAHNAAEQASAYNDASEFGQNWLDTRPSDDTTIPQVAPDFIDGETPPTAADGELLDMLGRVHPHAQLHCGDEFKSRALHRLQRAVDLQQPWPVPDQAAIVWRADLITILADLEHKQAAFLDYKRLLASRGTVLSAAALDVLAERQRQVSSEGWTPGHDDEHGAGSMARAAAVYALVGSSDGRVQGDELTPSITERLWPWGWNWFKPKSKRHNLVRAGALILAEIERMDRASAHVPAKGGEA